MTTENNTGTTETFIITEFKSGGIDTVKSFLENNFDTYSAEINAEVPQIDSEEGRKRIKALGAEINKKLSEVDSPMRDYLRDIKKQPKLIEAIAKENKEKFTKLRADILKPLEEAQAEQNAWLEELNQIPVTCAIPGVTSDELKGFIEYAESFDLNSVWPELKKKFKVAQENALTTARVTLERVEATEAQAAELKRLQDEAKAREDEEKARQAAEEARKQEQAKAAANALNAAQNRINAELNYDWVDNNGNVFPVSYYVTQKAKIEAVVIDGSWHPLQQEAEQVKARVVAQLDVTIQKVTEDEAKAEQQRIDREAQAKKDAEAAAQRQADEAAAAERKAIEDEQKETERLAKEREANKKHRTTVNRRNLAVLLAMGISEEDGKKVITAIAKGELPDIRIYY